MSPYLTPNVPDPAVNHIGQPDVFVLKAIAHGFGRRKLLLYIYVRLYIYGGADPIAFTGPVHGGTVFICGDGGYQYGSHCSDRN